MKKLVIICLAICWLDNASGAGVVESLYVQAGVGAIPRTQSSKLSDSVNVKDFGSKCDGITDDTVQIQVAENAIAVSGGTLIIPNTTCIISTLSMSSNVTLMGSGKNSILKRKAGTSQNLITASGQSSIAVVGLTIDGNSVANSGLFNNIYFYGCNDVLIENNYSINSIGNGISVHSGTDILNKTSTIIRNNTVKNSFFY